MTGTVLITGGSRGIGAAIAQRFGRGGWRVVVTCRSNLDRAQQIVAEIGNGSLCFQSDCGSHQEIMSLYNTLDEQGLTVDALVNNAGVTGPSRRLDEVTWDTLQMVTETNWIGLVVMCREAVLRMSKKHGGKGGCIVNLSSTATRLGSPGQWIDYAALKGAVDVLTNGLAREVGGEGIRVNAVAPGYTMTDLAREDEITTRFESMKHEVPLERIGRVEEIADAVFWLCSDEAAYVTGTVLPVAGGR